MTDAPQTLFAARHPCQRCGSEEWTDVDYSGCSDCREPAEDSGASAAFGQGPPPAGGWKLAMPGTRKPTYDHEWVSGIINENNRRGRALQQIAETARWYANNGDRLPLEVDHALCVEVLDVAERALDG